MSILPSPNDDTAQAFVRRWNEFGQLVTLVPGGLEQGRLSGFQPGTTPQPEHRRLSPYATFDVTKSRDGIHQTGTGNYVDFRKVQLRIWGTHPAVEEVIRFLRDPAGDGSVRVFNRVYLSTVAPNMGIVQLEENDLRKDDVTKDGEDVWMADLFYESWTSRPE